MKTTSFNEFKPDRCFLDVSVEIHRDLMKSAGKYLRSNINKPFVFSWAAECKACLSKRFKLKPNIYYFYYLLSTKLKRNIYYFNLIVPRWSVPLVSGTCGFRYEPIYCNGGKVGGGSHNCLFSLFFFSVSRPGVKIMTIFNSLWLPSYARYIY